MYLYAKVFQRNEKRALSSSSSSDKTIYKTSAIGLFIKPFEVFNYGKEKNNI